MIKIIRRGLLAIALLQGVAYSYSLDFYTKMEMKECYNRYDNIREMAGLLAGKFISLGITKGEAHWEHIIKVFNEADRLRTQIFKDCGVNTQRTLIDTAYDLEATLDVLAEFIRVGMMNDRQEL